MLKLASCALFVAVLAAPALAQTAIPDLRGTWKGQSESIVMGAGNAHHSAAPAPGPRLLARICRPCRKASPFWQATRQPPFIARVA